MSRQQHWRTIKHFCSVVVAILLISCGVPGKPQAGTSNQARLSQIVPPCGDSYRTGADRQAIEQAMLNGNEQEVVAAITAAKLHRGNQVGCPEENYSYIPADATATTLAEVADKWQRVHAPKLAAYTIGCPLIGRAAASTALGGYYAWLAGQTASLSALRDIARMLEAQQYSDAHAPWPAVATPGAFG